MVAGERAAFNPERLALARRRRGLSKVALGEAVGLTSRRIADFENQGDPPPPATVENLASALRFPAEFFYR
jgi:transcriptional regulator with XRE-family HTH domain